MSNMGAERTEVPRVRLLPHERWMADWMLKRQQSHQTAGVRKWQANYGPAGNQFIAAGLSTALPGCAVTLLGIVLLLLDFWAPAYVLVSIGIVLELASLPRLYQGAREGRRFRAGRPFQR